MRAVQDPTRLHEPAHPPLDCRLVHCRMRIVLYNVVETEAAVAAVSLVVRESVFVIADIAGGPMHTWLRNGICWERRGGWRAKEGG